MKKKYTINFASYERFLFLFIQILNFKIFKFSTPSKMLCQMCYQTWDATKYSLIWNRLNKTPKKTHPPQSVHIHCRHLILAHLFFRDFSFPSIFSYSPRLSFSLSLSLLSLILSSSLSLSLPLLSLFPSLRFFSPFSFFPFKTIQPL